MRRLARSLLLVALALPAPALATQAPNGESWELFRGWSAAPRVDFRVPYGSCTLAAQALADELGALRAVSLDPDDRDPRAVRVLVGPAWDAELLELLRPLGLEPMEAGFCLLGREYRGAGDALRAVFADPAQPGRPLVVLLGNDLERLAVYLDELPRLSRPELTVWADGDLALAGPLELDGTPREAELQDYQARRERYFASGESFEVEKVRLVLRRTLPREHLQAYTVAVLRASKQTLGWFGVRSNQAPALELYLYEHLEDMEECLGTGAAFVTSRVAPRAHVLFAPGMPHDSGAGAAQVLARELAGVPVPEWIAEGQPLAAAGSFLGWPLERWLAHLAAGRNLPLVPEILPDGAGATIDDLALRPARAMLFLQTVEGASPGALRALWKGARVDERRLSIAYGRAARSAAEGGMGARRERAGGRGAPFLRGLALIESERVRYSSSWVGEALLEAARLVPAPDAVSLTVLASAEDPAPVAAGARPRTAHGSATDLALLSAGAAARAHGLRVALALEVLARPHGAWADVLPWASPAERGEFWGRYERVALHYALLAELMGAEVYSFGANLATTPAGHFEDETPTEQQLEQRAQTWKSIVLRLQAAFRGSLTYGASLGDPSGEALFTPNLGHVGLHFFPGVAGAHAAPDDELLARTLRFELQQALDLAVRANKPLLLLQTGFPARRDSWALPHVPRGPADPAAQARYLGFLADALAADLENADTLRGFFLWNWPIDPEPDGAGDRGFSLRRPELAPVLARFFAR
ncbi:MAG TPA: hypothetical protein VF530_19540 [Planctomycetota bacterium]